MNAEKVLGEITEKRTFNKIYKGKEFVDNHDRLLLEETRQIIKNHVAIYLPDCIKKYVALYSVVDVRQ